MLTRRVQELLELAPHLEIAIHPRDARRLGVSTGSRIRVALRRGELTGHAQVTEAGRPGAVFVPFVNLEEEEANFLTNFAFDPLSKIPEYWETSAAISAGEPSLAGAAHRCR